MFPVLLFFMYLEKLEIQGFKSFANKNKLEFSAQSKDGKKGITSIVGPNGSGKSNIADAVRWVLGEQSVKTLRGKKGEDIIFSGSNKKSRLGIAEVSLFLKNEKKDKKGEKKDTNEISPFDYDELIITRRLTRNGDSEYLINNNRVRLLDIQILLAKANIGQKTYSIIGQGLVENFLNTSATEKKEFFDEATGVKSFQIKRDGALNKLEKSYDNLSQLEMLLTEISPRLKTLTRQVEKIKKRDKLETDLKNSQHIYYNHFYHKYASKLENLNQEILSLEEKISKKEKELEKTLEENKKFSQLTISPEEEALKEEIKEKHEKKNQLVKKQVQLQTEISLNLENQGNYDLSWLNNKKDELLNKKKDIKNQIEEEKTNQLLKKEEELKANWQKLQSESSQLEKDKEKKERTWEELNQLQEKLIRTNTVLESKMERKNNYDFQKNKETENSLKQSIEENNTDLSKYNLDDYIKKVEKLENELNVFDKSIKEKRETLKHLNQEIEEKSKQGIGKKTINQEINQFLNDLKEIEKEKNLEKIKELITKARQNFKEKVKELVGFDEEKLLAKIKDTQEDIISLSEKRQGKNEDLNNTKWHLSQKTREKEQKETKKKELEEQLKTIKKEADNILNDQEFNELEKEKSQLQDKIREKKDFLENLNIDKLSQRLNKEKEELKEKLNDCRFKISSKEEKIKLLEQNYFNIKREIEDIEDKINRSQNIASKDELKTQKDKIEKKIVTLEKDIKTIKESLEEYANKRQTKKEQLINNQKRADDLRSIIEKNNTLLHQYQLEATRQETKLEDLEETIKNENLNLIDIKKPLEVKDINPEEIDYSQLLKKISNYKKQLEQIGSLDPETESEYQKTKERYDFLVQQTNDLNEAINSLEKIISQLDEQIKSRFEKEFKVIAEKFNQYFTILFGGGQAQIIKQKEKEEGEDDDKNNKSKKWRKRSALGLSGIDIHAIPPGKKIQSIAMLSGGERALTAIALICAIINVNPSPFVVLDEVDAALDEANSEKLAKILEDLSSQTQFIIITHNRATMRRAEILYGITMQSDGISRLLSIKLEEAMKIENKK